MAHMFKRNNYLDELIVIEGEIKRKGFEDVLERIHLQKRESKYQVQQIVWW